MEGEVGTPRRDADAPAVARQRANQMAADEAGAAEDGDDAILGLNVGAFAQGASGSSAPTLFGFGSGAS